MGFSKVYSAQTDVLTARIVDIEVDLSNGLHSFSIVGLPDKAVEEARDRISAAIKNSGFASPKSKNQKVVISLAPADLKKEGPIFDLAMALAYLKAAGDASFDPQGKLFIGELSLDGKLRRVNGTLALVKGAKRAGFSSAFVPAENSDEAVLVEGIDIYGASDLAEVVRHLESEAGKTESAIFISKTKRIERPNAAPSAEIDLSDVKGQETAKRGLEIAAAGGHNIAMYGPPGTGKTMLAKAFIGLLPDLPFDDALEATAIHSIAGVLTEPVVTLPPLRAPHHTSSHVSLVGGGANLKPGEVTLAHKGVLFLDEFPEFDVRTIESLRQPLEDKHISISRAKGSAQFPADFILIAAMNPCPCGYYGFKGKECTCTPSQLVKYKKKLSGPIVDRIDLWVEVGNVPHASLISDTKGESTADVRARVLKAREIQRERFERIGLPARLNSQMGARDIVSLVRLDEETRKTLDQTAFHFNLSPRSYHRILKVARTIADLAGSQDITRNHIMEAFQYRPKNQGNS